MTTWNWPNRLDRSQGFGQGLLRVGRENGRQCPPNDWGPSNEGILARLASGLCLALVLTQQVHSIDEVSLFPFNHQLGMRTGSPEVPITV